MAGPLIYVSPKAQQMAEIMARKTSGTKAPQTHHYHVRLNTGDHACQCCDTDVTMSTANERNAAQSSARAPLGAPGRPLSRGERLAGMGARSADPLSAIGEICDRLGERIAAVFESMGLELPPPLEPPAESPLDLLIAHLTWLDRALTIAEHHVSGLERAVPPRAHPKQRNDVYQPRGEEAKSVVSNMGNLTFAPEHQQQDQFLGALVRGAGAVAGGLGALAGEVGEGVAGLARGAGRAVRTAGEIGAGAAQQVQQYRQEKREKELAEALQQQRFGPETDAFEGSRALAKQASPALGQAPLAPKESRSMASPRYAPADPREDRYQRGEGAEGPPRELVDTYSKGDPYRSGGVSSAPDASAPQRGGGKELRPLDPTTGATKYAWGPHPTRDSVPSTSDIIRSLSAKETKMMKQIRDELSIAMKARWN